MVQIQNNPFRIVFLFLPEFLTTFSSTSDVMRTIINDVMTEALPGKQVNLSVTKDGDIVVTVEGVELNAETFFAFTTTFDTALLPKLKQNIEENLESDGGNYDVTGAWTAWYRPVESVVDDGPVANLSEKFAMMLPSPKS